MSLLSRSRSARVALWISLAAAAAFAAPGCLFPEYSFNEPEPTAGNGAGTSTSTNTGGGSPTGGGGGSNPENCTNGVDDDNDGAADCADVKCTDHSCVPEVPTGWTGYFALYDSDPTGDPGCPSNFPSTTTPPYVGTNGISAPPADCECSCGNPTWTAGCAPLESIVIATGDATCGNMTYCSGQAQIPAGWDGSCYNQGYFPGGQLTCGPNTEPMCDVNTGDPCNVSVRATAIAATGQGTCQPNPVEVTLPDPVWARLGRACGDAPVGAGCNIGQACLPKPEVPYETGVCIAQDGDVACPAGAFTEKHVFFGDVMDERGCANDCACGPGANGVCPATVTIYSDTQLNTCVTAVATFAAGTCFDLANNPNIAGRRVSQPGAPTGGTCPATGGTPTGSATPINPKTYCCIP